MKTHVEFVSDAFPSYPNEDDSINPGIWGKRLAEYLIERLSAADIKTREPFPEDWGWEIPIENDSFPMSVGCSNQLESDGNRFLVFIEPSKPEVRKGLFKKIDTRSDVARVAEAIDAALKSHREVKDLRWWTDDEVN